MIFAFGKFELSDRSYEISRERFLYRKRSRLILMKEIEYG